MSFFPYIAMKSWFAKKWLDYFGDDHSLPNWVERALKCDSKLRSDWEADQEFQSQLRQSASAWGESAETGSPGNTDFEQVVVADSRKSGAVTSPENRRFGNEAYVAIALSLLAMVGFAVVVWSGRGSEVMPEDDFVAVAPDIKRGSENLAMDLRPILATAQAGQQVFVQIKTATLSATQQALTSPAASPLDASSFPESTRVARKVGLEIAETLQKMVGMFVDPTINHEIVD